MEGPCSWPMHRMERKGSSQEVQEAIEHTMPLNKPCLAIFAVCLVLCVFNEAGEAFIREGRTTDRKTLEALTAFSRRFRKMQSDEHHVSKDASTPNLLRAMRMKRIPKKP